MPVRNEYGFPVIPQDLGQRFARYGANVGRAVGNTVPGLGIGLVPALTAGGAAYAYAMNRGNQMANNPAVADRMANMRDLISKGYLPTDEEGVWIDPEGNTVDLSTAEETATVNINSLSNLSQLTPHIVDPDIAAETAPAIQDLGNGQVKVSTPADPTNEGLAAAEIRKEAREAQKPAKTTKSQTTTPRKNSSASSTITVDASRTTNDRPKNNNYDWFNTLLPLFAAGGLGYLLAK